MNTAAQSISARALEASGIEHEHALAIAEVIHQRGEDYATKADVEKAKNTILLALLAAVGILGGIELFA